MPNLLFYRISAAEIADGDTVSLAKVLKTCVELDSEGHTVVHVLHLSTNAYDNDPRALFDIPEMRTWCMKLFSAAPEIFVFLDQTSASWFVACIGSITIHKRTAQRTDYTFDQAATEKMLARIRDDLTGYLREVMSREDEVQTHLARVMDTVYRAVGRT